MAPKIVDRQKRKREIALKALGIFAQSGFEAASISQIADAVGMSKGTLYEYFVSKDELILESMKAWMDQMLEGVEQLVGDIEDPALKLTTLVQASVAVVDQEPMAMQLMIGATQLMLKDGDPSRFHFVRDAFHRFRMDVVNVLLEGVSKRVFRPEIAQDAEKIAINLLAYLDGIGMHYYLSRPFFDLQEQIDFYLKQLLHELQMEQGEV